MSMSDMYDVQVNRCVLGTVMLMSLSGATAGVTMWLTSGYSSTMIILLCSCSVVFVLIMFGMALSSSSTPSSSPTSRAPAPPPDLPPPYRNTWRLEFNTKTPDDVTYEPEGIYRPKNNIPYRGDVRFIWDLSPGGTTGDAGPTDTAFIVNIIPEDRPAGPSSGNRVYPGVSQHQHLVNSQNLSIAEDRIKGHTFGGDLSSVLQVHSQQGFAAGASTHLDDGLPRYEDLELG